MQRLTHILILLLVTFSAYAVVATPEPIMRQLPDGTWANVYMHGDENYHYLTTLNGELIPGSEVGIEHLSADLPEAKRVLSETQLSYYVPRTGKVYVPVILVNFEDLSFTMPDPVAQISDMYNGDGGQNPSATGSVHDYYIASSDSLLDLEFDVFGPYTLSKNMAYYGKNSSSSHMVNASDLVKEAASLASSAGVDFTKYDNDNDGYIDNLSIVVAGYNEAEGGEENTIWPHYSSIYGSDSYSGKRIRGYLMISEYRGSGGKVQAGIGTYCHEFGHALGLPDLYDTQNSSRYTVGIWDIMCSGSYNNNGCTPPSYSAFERFVMGWLTPTQLEIQGNYELAPLAEENTAYLLAAKDHNLNPMNPSPSEYFMIENRQAVGWDAGEDALVGTGLLVSHITFKSATWDRNTFNNGSILGYAIVGAYDSNPSKSTPYDLFPGKGNVTSWLPMLNNATELSEQMLQGIKEMTNNSVRFYYGPLSDDGVFFSCDEVKTLVTTYDTRAIEYDTVHVEVLVKNMPNDTLVMYMTNRNFDFSLDNGVTWITRQENAYMPLPNDTLIRFSVAFRHAPNRQTCDIRSGYFTVDSKVSWKTQQLYLTGTAPRPIYIQAPELLEADNISTTSLTANWIPEEDAEFYYATLFSLLDTEHIDVQNFDTFTSEEDIVRSGWTANFFNTTSVVAESNQAVLFTKTNEQLISKEYVVLPTSIRLWISNNYVYSSDEMIGGTLLIEGRTMNGDWITIDKLRIVNTTKNLEKEYMLQPTDSIMQFRFTYTHHGGEGGVALDGFQAHMNQTAQYVCSGTEREIYATSSSVIFHQLTPNTTYYFAVQAFEEKGCEPHFSPLSKLQSIKTLSEEDINVDLEVRRNEAGEYVVILPEPADGLSNICVYTLSGHLWWYMHIPYKTTQIQLPRLPQDEKYILKLFNGKLQRKEASSKLITQ